MNLLFGDLLSVVKLFFQGIKQLQNFYLLGKKLFDAAYVKPSFVPLLPSYINHKIYETTGSINHVLICYTF